MPNRVEKPVVGSAAIAPTSAAPSRAIHLSADAEIVPEIEKPHKMSARPSVNLSRMGCYVE